MFRFKIGLLALGALPFLACTTLKTASLRDARVLNPGKFEVTQELASAASVVGEVYNLAASRNSTVKDLVDSNWITPDTGAFPLVGLGLGVGVGNGWEVDAVIYTGLLDLAVRHPLSMLLDLGAKKQLHASRFFDWTGYGRLGYGQAWNLDVAGRNFELTTRSYEAEAGMLGMFKTSSRFFLYGNAGLNSGIIQYDLAEENASGVLRPVAKGYVPRNGVKGHLGMILDLWIADLQWEIGMLIQNSGVVHSVGLKVAWHSMRSKR